MKSIKEFILSNLLIENELSKLETELDIELGKSQLKLEKDSQYYPQFSQNIRKEAEEMALHYKVFFCLENSIRDLIESRLQEEFGSEWWDSNVPDDVKKRVEDRMNREKREAVSIRSTYPIDYTTFGELGEIIKVNWRTFSDTFSDLRAVESVLNRLNTVRGPIAHCCQLKEDEVVRLHLSVRDLFRTME